MKATARSLFLAALVAICVPGLALCDQTDSRLDALFETLQSSQDEVLLLETESEIWDIWYDSGEQQVDDKMEQAAEQLRNGNLAAAGRLYSEVIEMLPEFSEGWNRRATVRFYQRDYAGSLADIEETLRLEPRHFGAIWGLGMILGSQRDYERAILAFERLLEIKPNA
ncbi:MAG TPA: tetratricopeptide repeat protein, partial [Gammaproteobacteria bacterium]